MRTHVQVIIESDTRQLPRIQADSQGVKIGEDREEGDYDSHTHYVAPIIPWLHLDEFIEMLTAAKEYREKCYIPIQPLKKGKP